MFFLFFFLLLIGNLTFHQYGGTFRVFFVCRCECVSISQCAPTALVLLINLTERKKRKGFFGNDQPICFSVAGLFHGSRREKKSDVNQFSSGVAAPIYDFCFRGYFFLLCCINLLLYFGAHVLTCFFTSVFCSNLLFSLLRVFCSARVTKLKYFTSLFSHLFSIKFPYQIT